MSFKHIAVIAVVCVAGLVLLVCFNGGAGVTVSARGASSSLGAPANSTNLIYLPLVMRNYASPSPLWRFGTAKALRSLLDYNADDVRKLRLGWFLDWNATLDAPQPYGIEYVAVVRLKQWKLAPDSSWTLCCADCPYVTPYVYAVWP